MTAQPGLPADNQQDRISPVFLGAMLGRLPDHGGDLVTRYALEQLSRSAEQTLAEVVNRSVSLTPLDLSEQQENRQPHTLYYVVSAKGSPHSLTLAVDEEAARALVTPLLNDHLGVRAAGGLSDTEKGVLDYVFETWAEALNHRIAGLIGSMAPIRDGLGTNGMEPASAAMPDRTQYAWKLTIAPNQGRIDLLVPTGYDGNGLFHRIVTTDPGVETEPPWMDEPVAVRVALCPIDVDPSELSTANEGDVFMLGRTSLERLIADATLCTDTGWNIGDVEVLHDSPTALSVKLTSVDPWPQARTVAPVVFHPLIGYFELTGRKLASLRRGTVIDLSKPNPPSGQGSVLLRVSGRDYGWGELTQACGELGLRLTHLSEEAVTS